MRVKHAQFRAGSVSDRSMAGWPGLSLRSPGRDPSQTGGSLRSAPATPRLHRRPLPPNGGSKGQESVFSSGNSTPPANCLGWRRGVGRPAFTLVEMLIVVTIMLIITVAVVAVAPRFTDD